MLFLGSLGPSGSPQAWLFPAELCERMSLPGTGYDPTQQCSCGQNNCTICNLLLNLQLSSLTDLGGLGLKHSALTESTVSFCKPSERHRVLSRRPE